MKQIIVVFFLILIRANVSAQSVKGKVINIHNKPIIGAHLLVSEKSHAHSDDKGNFIIEGVSLGDSIKISHIGYEVKYLVINSFTSPVIINLDDKIICLEEIVIAPQINALNQITDIDIQTRPVSSAQDILRQIPGLIIGQHAGGGKAEQIFLRGFDIDHGTDIAITVDDLPVNMVSHAHGQGYADLHFVIPETIDNIDFGKGPYCSDKGNFNTAGYVNFKTKQNLDNSSVKVEMGQFNTNRIMSMFNLLNKDRHNSYIAAENLSTDGAFESPQNFNRINLFGKYSGYVSKTDKVTISLSYFDSKWDASGQIPQRAVDRGLISRFGAIDDTEGGNTSRSNILIHYDKYLDQQSFIKNCIYYSNYNFELYSNFTFFLEDSINGDQIKQKENRNIFGLNSEYSQTFLINSSTKGDFQLGVNLRNDQCLNNELSHTLNRKVTLNHIKFGDIYESNIGTYLNTSFHLGSWIINPALRFDYFNFHYKDELLTKYEIQSSTKSIFSPKLNILFNYTQNVQFYLKVGKGFHSNDTRVIIAQNGKRILPAAYGFDGGLMWKPIPQLLLNTAYWYLFLEQEFVYVGDAGIVEPSGETLRQGIDLNLRFQSFKWLFWNLDVNYTIARAAEEEIGEDYIPLAPDFTLVWGMNIIHNSGCYGGVIARYIKDRPANEDNSIVAKGYTVVDVNTGYNWGKIGFNVQLQNLLNTDWNETQFATESRLQNEPVPVEEIHFIPGTPFFLKGTIEYKF